MTTRHNDPRVTAKAIRDRHAATLAQIRTALGAKTSAEARDLLDGLVALLSAPSTANDHVAYLVESNVVAARMRRQQFEAAAAATTKPAKPAATKGDLAA